MPTDLEKGWNEKKNIIKKRLVSTGDYNENFQHIIKVMDKAIIQKTKPLKSFIK